MRGVMRVRGRGGGGAGVADGGRAVVLHCGSATLWQ